MTQSKHLSAALIAAALALAPAVTITPAFAQPQYTAEQKAKAKEFYTQGRKDYDLGNFDKAVDNFKKAYEVMDEPAFLFNIAQAYRQLNDCKNALFFYKGFLSRVKGVSDAQRMEVEGHIAALEKCLQEQDAIRNRQPDGTRTPEGLETGDNTGTGTGTDTGGGPTGGGDTGGGTTGGGGSGDGRVADRGGGPGGGDVDEPEDPDVVETTGQPKLMTLHAGLGGAAIGAGPVEIPVQFAFALTAGYPFALNDKLVLDVGVGASFTPVPWSNDDLAMEGSATMTGLFVNAGGSYEIASNISVRGDIGGGLLLLGGLEDGNPFTPPGSMVSGTLSTPLVRAGITGEYSFTPNVALAVTPVAFSYSPPVENMRDDIDALTRLEFMVGLGYRM